MWAELATGLGSVVGGFLGANSAESIARDQQRWSAEQSQIARDWQERMSNTAHQREVKDLLAAGLNPMLSFRSSGASSPSSPVASSPDVAAASARGRESMSSLLSGLASWVGTALQNENIRARTDLIKVQSDATGVSAKLNEQQILKVQQEYDNLKVQGKVLYEEVYKKYWESNAVRQTVLWRQDLYPLMLKAQELSNLLAAANVPGAQADADMWRRLGEAGKEGKLGVDLLKTLKQLFSK